MPPLTTHLLYLLASCAAFTTAQQAPPSTPYDYIVVGSGPGGAPLAANLARAGQSVLLLEAGDDQTNNPNISQIYNFNAAANDVAARWDFWTRHSEDAERERQYEHLVWRKTDGGFYVGLDPPAGAEELGIWYPRAGTLGGCAMHNGGICSLPQDADWDTIAERTGDASWRAENMRKYFVKLEKNAYLPANAPGHGFNGWLTNTAGDASWATQAGDGKTVAESIAAALGDNPAQLSQLVSRDLNALDPNRDQATGMFNLVTHGDAQGRRTGTGTYLKQTLADASRFPLTVQVDSLVSRVLYDEDAEEPTAIGVEYIQGKSMYAADPRYNAATKGTVKQAFAKKEVIIAGGAFNSPQILKLSGIGPAAELEKFGIPVVVDLPGVGERLDDNYEGYILTLAARPLVNPGGGFSIFLRTPTAPSTQRNIHAWCGSFSFEGFWPGFPQDYGPAEYECNMVHMGPKSQAGYVRLRSADPRATPDVNLMFFDKGADEDLTEMLDGIKLFRGALQNLTGATTAAPFRELHPCPATASNSTSGDVQCTDEEQKQRLKLQAHSHHPTSTCAIGGDDDEMAVLDSKFRVRGVKNLRVVDASAFPFVPGAFPVCPTMMLSEKASEDILNGA